MVEICQNVLKSSKAPPTILKKADPQISSASQVSKFRNKIHFRGIRVPRRFWDIWKLNWESREVIYVLGHATNFFFHQTSYCM